MQHFILCNTYRTSAWCHTRSSLLFCFIGRRYKEEQEQNGNEQQAQREKQILTLRMYKSNKKSLMNVQTFSKNRAVCFRRKRETRRTHTAAILHFSVPKLCYDTDLMLGFKNKSNHRAFIAGCWWLERDNNSWLTVFWLLFLHEDLSFVADTQSWWWHQIAVIHKAQEVLSREQALKSLGGWR